MPAIPGTYGISAWLASQPRGRAQWLLRILAGMNLAYLGIEYKYLHPNQMVAIVVGHNVPTFGLEPATFVLFMALVETLSGLLIMAGVLMRPLSGVLLIAFVFFSVILGESVFAHIIFYGLLVAFVTNSEGRWARPVATDKSGKIVILGGGFSGIHCAMRLERLLGEFTNVKVSLVHRESYFLFQPLLPEVIGGTVQPGNIVNPIRRIVPRTQFIQGEITSIDTKTKKVYTHLASGEKQMLEYDQLVVALEPEASFGKIPGLVEHALPMMTVGDGLFLRQHILERLQQAEVIVDKEKRHSLLTFSVIGGGLRGCATAAEIRELINSALISYSAIGRDDVRILLFESESRVISRFDPAMGEAARDRLKGIGVEVFTGTKVTAVTPDEVVIDSGKRFPCRTVIGALAFRNRIVSTLSGGCPDGRLPVDEFLRPRAMEGVFVTGDCAAIARESVTVAGDCGSADVEGPFMAWREIKMGRLAAYNALASIRQYSLSRWPRSKPSICIAALGRFVTVGSFFGIRVGGFFAWIMSRLLCLFTLPGLERNLRVVIDWILDIPFRNDIVVLAPQRTQKLGAAHYEAGDEIIRQGEKGECAYLLMAGEAEVVRQVGGKSEQVAKLKSGECFGEIALLSDVPRTATVKCLTPVDVVVLPRDQFMTLTEGYRELGNALKTRMSERISSSEQKSSMEKALEV
jgi:NADH dehydrogenase FAD-containing subunit/uncharacterized membrane protein YphA (DoxX/SURF4 family)